MALTPATLGNGGTRGRDCGRFSPKWPKNGLSFHTNIWYLVFPIPANTAFVSSVPPVTPSGGMLTFTLSSLLGVGGSQVITVTLTARPSRLTAAFTLQLDLMSHGGAGQARFA